MKVTTVLRLLVIGFATVVFAAACGDDGDDVTLDEVTEEQGIPADLEEVDIGGADQYVGQEVVVRGEVTAQINDTAFHIAGESGGNGLLVLTDQPVVDDLATNDVVRVSGVVREIDQQRFDSDFDRPWDDDYAEFGTRHAIDATDVQAVGEHDTELDDADEEAPADETGGS